MYELNVTVLTRGIRSDAQHSTQLTAHDDSFTTLLLLAVAWLNSQRDSVLKDYPFGDRDESIGIKLLVEGDVAVNIYLPRGDGWDDLFARSTLAIKQANLTLVKGVVDVAPTPA